MNKNYFDSLEILLAAAIEEDINTGDITSEAIFPENHMSKAEIISKEPGIFCGADVIKYCYNKIDNGIKIEIHKPDGTRVKPGDIVAGIEGRTKRILIGERIILNFIQRMSGIATFTGTLIEVLEGSGIKILDTRKTVPGYRMLDKYAVKTGGGYNHRMGLYDMVMIKDNHIKAAGSITSAVEIVRKTYDVKYRIEVEVTDIDEVREALDSGADIIMLDNMDNSLLTRSIKIINRKAEIEVSGNITGERLIELKDLDINYISIGALTHSVKAFDLSMKFIDK